MSWLSKMLENTYLVKFEGRDIDGDNYEGTIELKGSGFSVHEAAEYIRRFLNIKSDITFTHIIIIDMIKVHD